MKATVRPRAHHLSRSGVVVLDQGMSTASNGLFALSVAASVSAQAYGSFAVSYAVLGAALMMWRKGILLELSITRGSRLPSPGLEAQILRLLLWISPVLVGLPLAVLALARVGISPESVALAAVGPVVLAQDTLRIAHLSSDHRRRVLISDGAWLGVTATTFVLAIAGLVSYAAATAMWCLGAVLALLILTDPRRASLRTAWHAVRTAPPFLCRDQRHRRHNVVTGSVSPLTFVAMTAVIGRLAGNTVVATLAGTALLMFPITILLSSIPMLLAIGAPLGGPRARRILEVVLACTVLTVGWLAILLAMPSGIGAALLGDTWALVYPLLVLGAVVAGAQAIEATLTSALQLRGHSQVPLALGTFSNVTRLTYATVLSITFGTAAAILSAHLLLSATVTALALVALRRYSGPERPVGTEPA